jgi:two-component system response regulator (stage 0 sporulation protein A)
MSFGLRRLKKPVEYGILFDRRGGVHLQMLKLLIADGTEEFRLALAEQLAGSFVIRCCHQGKQTMEMINSFRPDVMVLDLMLPELDGVSLLQELAEQNAMPVVLATSRFTNDYVLEAAARYGVAYVMSKPCDIRATAARVRDLSARMKPAPLARPDTRTIVRNVLLSLNVPPKLRGYTYLLEAIVELMENPGQMVTKELYPTVGKRCYASRDQVERSIRSAIAVAYKNRNEQLWRQYFAPSAGMELSRPTNGTFITTLATRLAQDGHQGICRHNP